MKNIGFGLWDGRCRLSRAEISPELPEMAPSGSTAAFFHLNFTLTGQPAIIEQDFTLFTPFFQRDFLLTIQPIEQHFTLFIPTLLRPARTFFVLTLL